METEKKSGFSLDDFKLADESDLNLRNSAGQPSGWIWTFAGPGHPKTVAADEQQTKRALAIAEEQEKARVNGRKWKGSGDTVDDVRDRNIAYIIARLLRWSDGMTVDGQPFQCTPENARAILLNPGLGVYEQVNSYLTDEKSFTPRSPKI
jgi:hypothetical protein